MGVIQRRNGGPLFIAEGDLVTERALAAGCEPVAVLCSEKGAQRMAEFAPDYERYCYTASEDLRRNVTGLGVPLEVISLFKRPAPTDADALLARFTHGIYVDNVDNPVNVGSIARNMAAMGWDALFLDGNSADPLARRALRVSMGNAFSVPHARVVDTAAFIRNAAAAGITTMIASSPWTIPGQRRSISSRWISVSISPFTPRRNIRPAIRTSSWGLSLPMKSTGHACTRHR